MTTHVSYAITGEEIYDGRWRTIAPLSWTTPRAIGTDQEVGARSATITRMAGLADRADKRGLALVAKFISPAVVLDINASLEQQLHLVDSLIEGLVSGLDPER
jgi:hypothetical protein